MRLILLVGLAMGLAVGPAWAGPLFTPIGPFPGHGLDTSVNTLVTVSTPAQTVTVANGLNNGPFDGIEDTYVGVQNMSPLPVPSLALSSSTLPIFGFDGDGAFSFGPTGYEGPGTSFSITDSFHGTVSFAGGLDPGQQAFFALEEDITGASLVGTVTSGVPEPSTLALAGIGLGCLALRRFRRRKIA